jgi:hypothetical protein
VKNIISFSEKSERSVGMIIDIVPRGVFKQVTITHNNSVIDLGLIEDVDQPAIAEQFYDAWVAMKGKGLELGIGNEAT